MWDSEVGVGADLRGDVTEFEAFELQGENVDAATANGHVIDIRSGAPVVEVDEQDADAVVVNLKPAADEDAVASAPGEGQDDVAPAGVVDPPGRLELAPRWQLAIKRLLDIVLTVPVVVLLTPIYVLAAIAIVTTSRGPVFFSQDRIGKNGERFRFYKFRSMRRTAEYEKPQLQELNEVTGPIFMIRNDPRVTKVGRILRRLSIDELPQLFHVIAGHMTLVGPRPHLPEEVAAYTDRERRRLNVKPGITCLWQVSGRADIDFDQWIELDLQYIDDWSLWLDVKLMVMTIPAVVTGRGAY